MSKQNLSCQKKKCHVKKTKSCQQNNVMAKKSKKKQHHTQIPIQDGFIGIRLRKKPLTRPAPVTGVVNKLPAPGERPSELQPQAQQLSWD